MTDDIILKVENVSKQYRLGTIGTGTISHDLNRWWHSIRGKEDPYLKIGETNDRATKGTSDYVWALQDINFEVKRGEVLGIIGKNGAGKSTLLKILSRVTTPTTGAMKSRGRIAALLEVGTGFNPELTGRENIYLNGAILGMTKKEISSKLDEIIEFSGCERYIDTPTKRYSSGMTVRLGFAVAAFLEPEILIIDEVLAVGDAEFQKKALGKMQDVSKNDGRTVLFVSHNMAAVKSLCTRGILLENGQIKYIDEINNIVQKYLSVDDSALNFRKNINFSKDNFKLLSIGAKTVNADYFVPMSRDQQIEIQFEFINNQDNPIHFTLKFKGDDGNYFMTTAMPKDFIIKTNSARKASIFFSKNFFNVGSFYVDLFIIKNGREAIFVENDILIFTINPEINIGGWLGPELGYVRGEFECRLYD
jgi:lipopolysaccharide transport system ATP-binding protein